MGRAELPLPLALRQKIQESLDIRSGQTLLTTNKEMAAAFRNQPSNPRFLHRLHVLMDAFVAHRPEPFSLINTIDIGDAVTIAYSIHHDDLFEVRPAVTRGARPYTYDEILDLVAPFGKTPVALRYAGFEWAPPDYGLTDAAAIQEKLIADVTGGRMERLARLLEWLHGRPRDVLSHGEYLVAWQGGRFRWTPKQHRGGERTLTLEESLAVGAQAQDIQVMRLVDEKSDRFLDYQRARGFNLPAGSHDWLFH